jgi:hypothetical protein
MAYVTLPTQTSADLDSAANVNQLQENITYIGGAAGSTNRHTVLYGPVNTSTGFPNALSSGTGLSVVWSASSATATYISFANGWGAIGAIDTIILLESNLTFASLTNSNTSYLYFQKESGGTITAGFSTIAPTYAQIAPSASAGMPWFDVKNYKMYFYSTTTWVRKDRVFCGEVTASGTALASISTYAYNGYYTSNETSTPAVNTAVSFSHNIGTKMILAHAYAINLSTEYGYTVGTIVPVYVNDGGGAQDISVPVNISRTTLTFKGGFNVPFYVQKLDTNGVGAATVSKWNIFIRARREF